MGFTHGTIRVDGSLSADALDGWISSDAVVEYVTEDVAVAVAPSECRSTSRPVSAEDERVRCWVIGDVYGYDAGTVGRSGGYVPRPGDVDPAEFCVSRYERDGIDFVRGLNGNFTLLVYDRERRTVAFCTDRLGTVPLFWTQADDALVFSTNIQLLPSHPAVDTAFDPAYLHEYLAFRRTFGVKTPLEGIETLQPGATTTVSLVDGTVTTDHYWRPRYRPREESFEWFVDEFVSRFRTILDEWTNDAREYGVLLSGGSDSRLLLAGLDDATAFHMSDWMNAEARIAKRVALAADVEFEVLDRGAKYRIGALERNRLAPTFNGWFTQTYTSGFEDVLTDRVDGLLSGLYGDTLFRGFAVPSHTVSIDPLGSVRVPIERSIETVDEYVDLLLEGAHDGFDLPTDLRTTLESNVYRDGDRIVHHGVAYDSLDDLVYYGNCYPLTNDDDVRFHTGLRRLLPYRTPFLDDRLVDLSLSMPIRYRLRRNIVDRAVDRLAPDLAAIPHANTGVSLSRSFATKYAAENVLAFWRAHAPIGTPPKPYLTHGPWLDDAELLRSFDFVTDVLADNEAIADALPGLDAETIDELYCAHRRGENYVGELYTLLTVLTMPVTERVLTRATEVPHGQRVEPCPHGHEAESCRLCVQPEVVGSD